MKTSKKIAIGCGSIVAIGILGIASIIAIIAISQNKYDKIVNPMVDEMMPILATWDYNNYKQFIAPKALEQIKEEEMIKLFGMFRRLGELVDYQSPTFQKIAATTNNPYGKLIQYAISAQFVNGKATITLVLVPTAKNEVKIWYISINSDAFIVPVEDANSETKPENQEG